MLEKGVYMKEKRKNGTVRAAVSVVKVLLAMYLATGIFLLILAGLLYRFELSENAVNIGIIVIYVLTGFAGGFLMGKLQGNRKFLWGAVTGLLYFGLLLLVSLAVWKGLHSGMTHVITTLVMCTASGMIGGMLS